MTTISAKVVKDSISPEGVRITTFHMHYPRCIHSELLTHRVFSRNARSSRAVPVKTIIQEVIDDPFIPLHWGKNQAGMQAEHETNNKVEIPYPAVDDGDIYMDLSSVDRETAWLALRDIVVEYAKSFDYAGYHKQIINRILEPFAHIDTLVTSTSYNNFFHLRDHKDAEPHIAILAREAKVAMNDSMPQPLKFGEWHLPFDMEDGLDLDTKIKLSVARCARISYKPFDGDASIEKELDRYEKLVGSSPLHASPAEHQATPDVKIKGHEEPYGEWRIEGWAHPSLHGNLYGWKQFRKTLRDEFVPG